MNTLTRKLVLTMLTVVLTVVALGSTTFAWFTLTNTSVIQNFEVSVATDIGIEVALGAAAEPLENLEFKTVITTEDIEAYILAEYGAFAFSHVTSEDGINFTELSGAGVTSGYLSLPFHFRSMSSNEINWSAVTISATDSSYTTATTFVDSKGVSRTAGSSFTVNTADAIRLSVTGDVASVQTTLVYENPSSLTNTVLDAQANADLTGANGAVAFYTAVTSLAPTGADDVTVVDTVQVISGQQVLTLAAGQTANYGQEYHGTILINVWFEGWDAEAFNALLGRAVTIGFTFTA